MTFSIMSDMRINLMFSGGMDVVFEHHTFPAITKDSRLNRTMKVVNFRFKISDSAR